MSSSPISEELARRTEVAERLQALEEHSVMGALSDGRSERARSIDHPFLTAARERYDRVAGAVGIEPRDPFLDQRVISLCLRLPDRQLLHDGWPKAIVRDSARLGLPDEVRWRVGKEHLGWAFTSALLGGMGERMGRDLDSNLDAVRPYVNHHSIENCRNVDGTRGATCEREAYHVLLLAEWLRCYADRPSAKLATGGRGGS